MADNGQRNLPHIYLKEHGRRRDFVSPQGGGGGSDPPSRDRAEHGRRLERALDEALDAGIRQIEARDAEIAGDARKGFYLEFDLPADQRKILDKLEDRRGAEQIELVSVRRPTGDSKEGISATVFVPESKHEVYPRKVRQYREEETPKGRPKNEALIAGIDDVRLASVASLYTGPDMTAFPEINEKAWWEIWLRPGRMSALEHAAERLDIKLREYDIRFVERSVVLAQTTPGTLKRIIENTDAIAELRLARDNPGFFMELDSRDQRIRVDELASRTQAPPEHAPAVCVLDSGSTRLHPLIEPALSANDQQAWHSGWAVEDIGQWHGHGTQMSGLALYGDLTPLLTSSDPIVLEHRLESVKILPDKGQNPRELYGHITATAISAAEIQSPNRKRAFCLAVTTDESNWLGRPASWSAKIDDLCYGDEQDRRLVVISAGNVNLPYLANGYLVQNDAASIETPAQAWNALTVGATTEKHTIADPTYDGWKPLAPVGDLSPQSRTSVTWDDDWPLKPDVVFEGGNYGIDPSTGYADPVEDLLLLTTHNRINERLFTVTKDTSAATALVSRMAARIYADKSDLWPETVRALIVHSAEWTPAMRGHLSQGMRKRSLYRRYGYGNPNLDRALRSVNNDVTLVIEGKMQPFKYEDSRIKTCDMVMHELPWPKESLGELDGTSSVEMKVTLSYFIEPNPGERGWTQRHRYASHGLRFNVKRAEETLHRFMKRINRAARDENSRLPVSAGADSGWVIGPRLRDRGSIHSDVWQGTAVELASRDSISVRPVGGWWREKKNLERYDRNIRYSLIVTLRTQVDVNLYAEIQSQMEVPTEAEIETTP